MDIFVTKLNNLANTEASFIVESDSLQAEPLKELCADIERKRFAITEKMLADGECYIFPATNDKGQIIHSYLSKEQVRILSTDGEEITEAVGIIDWYIDNNNNVYYLLRRHTLSDGNLTISYGIVDNNNRPAHLEKWANLNGLSYKFNNANHIGFGRFKSPASSRGLSPIYGVPLNFGCEEIENKIFNDLRLIEAEFKNGKSVIFTDPLNFVPKKENDKAIKVYGPGSDVMENIIPITNRAGQNGPNIDIFNPKLRFSEHYSKLVADLGLYEKQVGTSKGILTDNETSETATATAVKRANADTLTLLNKIHTAIDAGNEMTLKADSVFLNISADLWNYKSDWYDPFEDPAEQWKRLLDAKQEGAAEVADLIKWLYPGISDEEIENKKAKIVAESQNSAQFAFDNMLSGGR